MPFRWIDLLVKRRTLQDKYIFLCGYQYPIINLKNSIKFQRNNLHSLGFEPKTVWFQVSIVSKTISSVDFYGCLYMKCSFFSPTFQIWKIKSWRLLNLNKKYFWVTNCKSENCYSYFFRVSFKIRMQFLFYSIKSQLPNHFLIISPFSPRRAVQFKNPFAQMNLFDSLTF
jgi:hypothetical protein